VVVQTGGKSAAGGATVSSNDTGEAAMRITSASVILLGVSVATTACSGDRAVKTIPIIIQ
jgi:hypothetical protein